MLALTLRKIWKHQSNTFGSSILVRGFNFNKWTTVSRCCSHFQSEFTGSVVSSSMMSSRKRVDNRKRVNDDGAVSDTVGNMVGGDVKNEIVSRVGKGVLASGREGRATRSKRAAIKIEVEQDNARNEEEYSKYFQKEEMVSANAVKEEERSAKVDLLDNEESDLKPSVSPSKKKKPEQVKVDPPENWEEMLENIKTMRSTKTAAVDTMGCERTADVKQEPMVQRFQTLVSLMLSSQTRDQVTYAAMERLKEKGLTVQTILEIDEQELAELLKPVSFYKRKAVYIKKTAGILRETYADDIPRTVKDLCALPGVGPKMAYICMNAAWNENAGIGVDTHVHRISNRLKWTGTKGTSTPEKTREALESWLPKEVWQEVNILLVGFGQEICLPIGPKCNTCLNKDICPSSQISRKSKKKK